MNIVQCPNCSIYIEVLQLNCQIFRCGILKETMQQIPPHSSKDVCDKLKEDDLIFGCGKPFKVCIIDGKYHPEITEYI
jgi:hypothetical protein